MIRMARGSQQGQFHQVFLQTHTILCVVEHGHNVIPAKQAGVTTTGHLETRLLVELALVGAALSAATS